jgi:fatty-acyl-CoA synthase
VKREVIMFRYGIGNWVTKRALLDGDKLAVIFEGKEWTYRQFNERINQLARGLISLGLKKGDRVAILSFNCNQYMELYWACAKTGIVLVPLNFRLVSRELEYFIKECEIKEFFYGEELSEVVNELKALPSLQMIQRYICIGTQCDGDLEYEKFLDEFSTEEPEVADPPGMEDPQVILFTSGTTGRQKGAILPHRKTLWNTINNELAFDMTGDVRYLLNLPMFHSGGMFIATMPIIHRGGTILIHRHFDPKMALEDIERYKINLLGGVPAMLQMIISEPDFDNYDLSSIQSVTVGAQITPVSLLEKIKEKFKVPAVGQVFGCTETSVVITLTPNRQLDSKKTGSVGLPLFHGEVKVANEKGKEVQWGSGEIGEICYRGPMTMLGYLNMPEKTKEAIDEDGWFHFGDMATVDEDGYIYVVDRKSDMYISGGENVYPKEVENILIDHPKIIEIAIIPKPDEKWGEIGLAIVNPVPGETLTEREVLEFGVGKIAKYKLPKEAIITDEPIPKTVTQKVYKYKLVEKYVGEKE